MKTGYQKLISLGSMVSLAGFVLSGPAALAVVILIKPQPPWVSARVFAENYSFVQDIPYYFGILLIGGMLMVITAHYLNYTGENSQVRFHLLIAICWAVVFCTLIAFNYICQTTFVRNLALHYKPEYDGVISTFSMSNPLSICWANEMWGYGILGVATWLMSGYYRDKSKIIHALLVANGMVSIAGVIFTILYVSWVLTVYGLIAYAAWNLLMIALMLLIYKDSVKIAQAAG